MATYTYDCLRCKSTFSTISDSPTRCPLCKATNWDKLDKDVKKHLIEPTIEIRERFQAGAQCSWRDCTHPAIDMHPILDVPVCGYHRKAKRVKSYKKAARPGSEYIPPAFGSVNHVNLTPRRSAPWSTLRTSSKGLNGPVELKNAVRVCLVCGAPIERSFKWCRDCFNKLPEDVKSQWYRERRNHYRSPQPNLQATSDELALRLESAQRLGSNREETCQNSSN